MPSPLLVNNISIELNSECCDGPGMLTNLTSVVGGTVNQQFTLTQTNADGTASPFDLTNSVVKMQIDFPTPLLLTSLNGGITLTDVGNGQGRIGISSTQSAAQPVGSFSYDFWTESNDEPPQTLQWFKGQYKLLARITPIP